MDGKLPNDWEWVKLGEVCTIQTGKYDANHAKPTGKYRFYTCAFEFMYCDTNRFKGESLILPGNGANVGEVFYYNGEFDAYQRTYVLNEIKSFPKYLYYHLLGNWKRKNQDKQFGSATNYIRMGNFTNYELPLPPKPTQLAIVSKIEELFSEIENGIKSLFTAKEQLKKYRQSVLKWAFEGKLSESGFTRLKDEQDSVYKKILQSSNSENSDSDKGELPEGWALNKLGDYIIKIEAGKSFKCNERRPINNEIGVLKVSAITWAEFNENESKTVLDSSKINESYFVKKGDFILSRANTIELVGNSVIVKSVSKKVMLSDKTLRIIFNDKVNNYYCLYFLRSKTGRQQIETLSTGNQESMRNIGQERIKQIQIPYCSIEEQNKIVEAIESRLSVADKMEESITESLQQAEALKQSILKKAFEGKLV